MKEKTSVKVDVSCGDTDKIVFKFGSTGVTEEEDIIWDLGSEDSDNVKKLFNKVLKTIIIGNHDVIFTDISADQNNVGSWNKEACSAIVNVLNKEVKKVKKDLSNKK